MAIDVVMPQLGESITEGTIVRWNKHLGDPVDRDEPLFEISTDKIDAEIPSPAAGVLAEILAVEGDTVPVDSVVARIGQTGEESPVVEADPSPAPAASGDGAPATRVVGRTEPAGRASPGPARSSPVVRKLAREHGIDITTITGTGAGGRVTKSDVMRHIGSSAAGTIGESTAGGPGPSDVTGEAGGRVEKMTPMRRQIAERMVASRRTAAHVHTMFDVDFSRVTELRRRHQAAHRGPGTPLTPLTFVAKAVVDALGAVPVVNASLNGDTILYHPDINLGIAVALDWGLIVPVVKRAQDRTLLELATAIRDLSERARSRRLTPADVERGTFTITNPGRFGSIVGMPIINQPQLAILCVGLIEARPVVVSGSVVARPRAYLTLGFDHRVIDGAVADRFMSVVKKTIEEFDEALL